MKKLKKEVLKQSKYKIAEARLIGLFPEVLLQIKIIKN